MADPCLCRDPLIPFTEDKPSDSLFEVHSETRPTAAQLNQSKSSRLLATPVRAYQYFQARFSFEPVQRDPMAIGMNPKLRPSCPVTKEEALPVVRRIKKLRHSLDYMTVARAMVIEKFFTDPEGMETRVLAGKLEIKRQTRINWLSRDIGRWISEWGEHLDSMEAAQKSRPAPRPKGAPLRDADIQWIALQLLDKPWRSLSYVRHVVQTAAGRDGEHAHLKTVSKSTISRLKYRIQTSMRLLHEARQRKATTKAGDKGFTASEPPLEFPADVLDEATGT